MNSEENRHWRMTLIAAVAENGAIGRDNKLIYYLPDDLRRFKALTTGHTIIMGRRTFESLPKGALPNRRNIVLTRKGKAEDFPGCDVYGGLYEALLDCREDEDIYIIGGSSLYNEAMPLATRLCLTLVHDTPSDADTFFPLLTPEWKEVAREDRPADERHAVPFSFVDYIR